MMRATVTVGNLQALVEGTPDELLALVTSIATGEPPRAMPLVVSTTMKTTKPAKVTTARATAMRKQGEYMGALRKLSAKDRERVKAVTRTEGRDRGLAYARRLASA